MLILVFRQSCEGEIKTPTLPQRTRQGWGNRALSIVVSQRSFLFRSFKIRTIARIVFQLRVVAGTPNSLSIWPR